MPHSWRFQKEIFFCVNVGVVMSPSGRKSKGKFGALSHVQNIHEHYINLHE